MNWYYRKLNFFRKIVFFSKEFSSGIVDLVLFRLKIYDTYLSRQNALDKTIVVTGLELNHRVIRNCKYLKRESGFKIVLLIHRQSSTSDLEDTYYDLLIRYRNKNHLKRILFCSDKLKLIYGFASKASYVRAAIQSSGCPTIFDPYDCTVIYYGLHPNQKWMQKEIVHEKYCFENCSAILARNLEINKSFEIYNLKKQKVILFGDYCDNDTFVNSEKIKSDSISIIYCGGIYSRHQQKSAHGIGSFFDFISSINEQKIDFHIYPSPHTQPEVYLDYFEESKNLTHLKIHKTVLQKNLPSEISGYHFGVSPNFKEESSAVLTDKLIRGTSLKFFNFLEAGLPILMSSEMKYMAWLVERYKIGIVFSKEDIPQLSVIIKSFDYSELQKNVLAIREKLSMNHNMNRLINFIENLK